MSISNADRQRKFRAMKTLELREFRFALVLQRLYESDYSALELKEILNFLSTVRSIS